jgi:hypothetical protein
MKGAVQMYRRAALEQEEARRSLERALLEAVRRELEEACTTEDRKAQLIGRLAIEFSNAIDGRTRGAP